MFLLVQLSNNKTSRNRQFDTIACRPGSKLSTEEAAHIYYITVTNHPYTLIMLFDCA
jgi:hypothetical protein